MATPFEDLPFVDSAEDLLDTAFSSAARAAESNSGVDSQRAQTQRAANSLSGSLENLVSGFPSFTHLDPPYDELADAVVDVDEVRRVLGRVDGVSSQIQSVAAETQRELADADSSQEAVDSRKRAFARFDSIVSELETDLQLLAEAREALIAIPEVSDDPTVALAGAPNVGKSTILREMTAADPDVDTYSFTTQNLVVGHLDVDTPGERLQIVETPGLLDRDTEERNRMERQSLIALEQVADVVFWIYDASESCGYTLETQRRLRSDVVPPELPVLEVANKADLEFQRDVDFDVEISAEDEEDVSRLEKEIRSRLQPETVERLPDE